MNVFVFDIETVPDVESGERLLDLSGQPQADIAQAMFSLNKESTGSSFIKHHLQKVVAISAVFRHGDQLKVWSLGESTAQEPELIQRFFAGIEKFLPTLVSWNGSGFDLPVLHYRALYHGIAAATYWECGEQDNGFKYNNYLNRYHYRHLDLMDVLSGYQQKAYARLDDIAVMLGLPRKMGLGGDKVWDFYQQGEIEQIRHYCESDVLNTYLIYLRFQLMRGALTPDQYKNEIELTKNTLRQSPAAHHQSFLTIWEENDVKISAPFRHPTE